MSALVRRGVRRVRREALSLLGRTSFGTITSFVTDRPMVALTFDDGPHPKWTPRVLDVLDRYGAKATFFVVGESVERYPAVVRRLHEEGHALGNHSHRHVSFPRNRPDVRRHELHACAAALAPYGQRAKLFRPPYLSQNLASRFLTWRSGYEVIACNRDARDWQERTVEEMTGDLAQLDAGDVVLLHDTLHGEPDRSRAAMIDTLDTVLRRHASRFEFVTVPTLLGAGRPRREIWLNLPSKIPRSERRAGLRDRARQLGEDG